MHNCYKTKRLEPLVLFKNRRVLITTDLTNTMNGAKHLTFIIVILVAKCNCVCPNYIRHTYVTLVGHAVED